MGKLKEFSEKLFIFDLNSNFFLVHKYLDTFCTFGLFSQSRIVKSFNKFLWSILAIHMFFMIYEVIKTIFSPEIDLTTVMDKIYIIFGISLGITKMLLLKIYSKNFSKIVHSVNQKSFKIMEDYSIHIRKRLYERYNKFVVLMSLFYFVLTTGWILSLKNLVFIDFLAKFYSFGFYGWTFIYFKSGMIFIGLLLVFIAEFDILNRAFSRSFEYVKDMPNGPNTSIRKEMTNNIDQFNELNVHLEGVKMYYSIVFLLQMVFSSLIIAFNCITLVDRSKNDMILQALHSAGMTIFTALEIFLLCRLMDRLNDTVCVLANI